MSKLYKHLKTIYLHRKYVRQMCWKMKFVWQGITHDLSKYSIEELNNEELAALKLTYLLYRLHKYLNREEKGLCPLLNRVSMSIKSLPYYTYDADPYDMIHDPHTPIKATYHSGEYVDIKPKIKDVWKKEIDQVLTKEK